MLYWQKVRKKYNVNTDWWWAKTKTISAFINVFGRLALACEWNDGAFDVALIYVSLGVSLVISCSCECVLMPLNTTFGVLLFLCNAQWAEDLPQVCMLKTSIFVLSKITAMVLCLNINSITTQLRAFVISLPNFFPVHFLLWKYSKLLVNHLTNYQYWAF